jgi:hypothetical protein
MQTKQKRNENMERGILLDNPGNSLITDSVSQRYASFQKIFLAKSAHPYDT